MIYTHVLNRGPAAERSTADLDVQPLTSLAALTSDVRQDALPGPGVYLGVQTTRPGEAASARIERSGGRHRAIDHRRNTPPGLAASATIRRPAYPGVEFKFAAQGPTPGRLMVSRPGKLHI
jgi:hypothetical protein